MHGKCILTQTKSVSETRCFPSYSSFSKWFTKQSFAVRRVCHDKKLSGCWFASYKHFLLDLLTASSGQVHSSKANLLIILKMSKCCLCCCSVSPLLWLLVTNLLRAPITVRLPEIMEHRGCCWCAETSRNTQEKTKICAYRTTNGLRKDTVISSLGSHVFCVLKLHNIMTAFCNLSDMKKASYPVLRRVIQEQHTFCVVTKWTFQESRPKKQRKCPAAGACGWASSGQQGRDAAGQGCCRAGMQQGRDAAAQGDQHSTGGCPGAKLAVEAAQAVPAEAAIGGQAVPGQAERVYLAAEGSAPCPAPWGCTGSGSAPRSCCSLRSCSTLPWASPSRWEQLPAALLCSAAQAHFDKFSAGKY